MDNDTIRSRLTRLLQKSRKALRLYTTFGKIPGNDVNELGEIQVREWKSANANLIRELTRVMANVNQRKLVAEICVLRDRFYQEWRELEADLHLKQRSLITSSENGDFIRASSLSRELVLVKAKVQSAQAVHHELHEVIKRSSAKLVSPPIELLDERALPEDQSSEAVPELSNVIRMRRRV